MKQAEDGASNRELYALLNVSPEASDEEIRKAYRQFAQVYHPDKIQATGVTFSPKSFYRIKLPNYDFISSVTHLTILLRLVRFVYASNYRLY